MSQALANLKKNAAEEVADLGQRARKAALILAQASGEQKALALTSAAAALRREQAHLLAANAKDLAAAKAAGMSAPLLDRLALTPERIEAMAKGLEEVAALPDPVGRELARFVRPNGLIIRRVSVPLGVIAIIYESRPNVTADAGALCLKAGNAAILRGGSESFHSSQAILAILREGLKIAGLPEDALQAPSVTDRAIVGALLTATDFVDVIVPRGGKGLVKRVMEEARVPVLAHLEGNNHTYIHDRADQDKSRRIALNAKMRRVSVCGATETLLIDRAVLASHLPGIVEVLVKAGCELRGDKAAQAIDPRIKPASEVDWSTEFLAPILAIKTVAGMDEALAHIARYGSKHTEAIVTEDQDAARRFQQEVDAAIVLVNASTQFADGGEFGMGAEIGIATGRLHARGPVGANELTTFKYLVDGTGQIRP